MRVTMLTHSTFRASSRISPPPRAGATLIYRTYPFVFVKWRRRCSLLRHHEPSLTRSWQCMLARRRNMTGPYNHFRTDTFLHRSNHTVCPSRFVLHVTLPKPAALYSMSLHQMPMYSAQGTTSSIISAHLESNLSSAAISLTLINSEQVRSLHHSRNYKSRSSRSYASYGHCQLSWPSSFPTTMDVPSSLLQKD